MKRSFWVELSVILLSVVLLIPPFIQQETVKASSQGINDGKPYIKEYDANGNLIKSYSDKEIEILMEKAKESKRLLETEPKNTDGGPFANFYDKNNLLIGSSDPNAVKEQQAVLAEIEAAGNLPHIYSAATFSNYVMVNVGGYFKNPQSITIHPKQKVTSLIIKTYKQGDSTPSGSTKLGNFSTGINVPLVGIAQNQLGTGHYNIQFNNENTADDTIYLNSGTLYYQ